MSGLNRFVSETRGELRVWAVAAILSSALLLILYSCLPDLRRTPGWQFLYSSLCEIVVSAGFVVLTLIAAPAASYEAEVSLPNVEHLLCAEYRPLLLTILAFDVAANSWRLLMYLDLIVVYHNPFRPNTARPLYHIGVALIASLSALGMSGSGLLCAPDSDQVNLLTLTWELIYAPFLLFVLIGGSLYVAVKALLSSGESSNPISQLIRQRVS